MKGGGLLVLDEDLRRVSVFNAAGHFVRSFGVNAGAGHTLAVSPDARIWINGYLRTGQVYTTVVYDTLGRQLGSRFRPTLRDIAFSQHGNSGKVAQVHGRMVWATGQPGTWVEDTPGGDRRRGLEVAPELEPRTIPHVSGTPLRVSPVGTYAIVALYAARVGIIYYKQRDSEPLGTADFFLDVLTVDGAYLGTTLLPVQGKVNPAATPDGRRILLSSLDPYPRVIEYELLDWPVR
jgi:hypothetical protein